MSKKKTSSWPNKEKLKIASSFKYGVKESRNDFRAQKYTFYYGKSVSVYDHTPKGMYLAIDISSGGELK